MTAVAFPRAFAVRFKDLDRWDPSSFHRIFWHWPANVMRPLGSVLKVRKEKVDRKAMKFSDLQPITIHFDGTIDKREVDGNREYTMELFHTRPGDIVVAKIDLKNGAVSIIPAGWTNTVVTGHFAVYEPDLLALIPEYLRLLIQTRFFKAHLWRNKVGAEGRKEVKLDFFEAQPIPLPPLAEQRKIVAAWEASRKAAAATAARIAQLEADIEARFLADLGLKAPAQATLPKCFAVNWKDLLRWSVGHIRMAATSVDLSAGKYPAVALGECLIETMNGYCIKPVAGPTPNKMLKLNALRPAGLDLSASKYINVPDKTAKRFHLCKGDLLICRSVGSFDHIAKCALVESDAPSILFPDIIIRARFNAKMIPEYAREFIQTKPGRTHFQQNARTAVGMWKIGGDDIANLPIPLPPLNIQRQIVERVAKRRAEIATLKADAKAQADAAKADVEAMILGTKPTA